jgi:hypothetical protein
VGTRAALNASSCGTPLGTFGALAVQMGQRLCSLREVICGWSAQELAKCLGVRAESIERMDLALWRERGRAPRLLGICPPAAWRICGKCSGDEGLVMPTLEARKGDGSEDQLGKAVSTYGAWHEPAGCGPGRSEPLKPSLGMRALRSLARWGREQGKGTGGYCLVLGVAGERCSQTDLLRGRMEREKGVEPEELLACESALQAVLRRNIT